MLTRLGWFSSTDAGLAPEESQLWRQGDVFSERKIVEADSRGRPVMRSAPHGVAIISQSCDVSRRDRPTLQIAPVVVLDEIKSKEAQKGRRPQFAHLAAIGNHHFADLSSIATINKNALLGNLPRHGVVTDEAVRRFAGSVARRFGRFAFPDDVVKCLEPIRETIVSKSSRPKSPIGALLNDILQLRIYVEPDWSIPPYDIILILILEVDAMPLGTTVDLPIMPEDLRRRYLDNEGRVRMNSSQVAQDLARETDQSRKYWLWHYFTQTLAQACESTADRLQLRGVVRSVAAELASADDFPLSRMLCTEALDLDYLSPPLPRN